jgi:hypothetical protein
MKRLLGRYAMSQGDYEKGNGHVIIDGDRSQKLKTQITKRIKRVLHPIFKLCSHRVVNEEDSFLHFQTSSQLCALWWNSLVSKSCATSGNVAPLWINQ